MISQYKYVLYYVSVDFGYDWNWARPLGQASGHDAKTHKEFYRLSDSTIQLSKVSVILFCCSSVFDRVLVKYISLPRKFCLLTTLCKDYWSYPLDILLGNIPHEKLIPGKFPFLKKNCQTPAININHGHSPDISLWKIPFPRHFPQNISWASLPICC